VWLPSNVVTAQHFFSLGFTHVLPYGYDHVLFILAMYFLHKNLKDLLWLSLCFTLAHSLTLAFGAFHVVPIHSAITEPLIALSITATALQRLLSKQQPAYRYLMVALFGLLHGSGFAGALSEELGRSQSWILPLAMFNTGVELAQVCILMICFQLFHRMLSKHPKYETFVVLPLCSLIASIGLTLFISRFVSVFS